MSHRESTPATPEPTVAAIIAAAMSFHAFANQWRETVGGSECQKVWAVEAVVTMGFTMCAFKVGSEACEFFTWESEFLPFL